MSLHPQPSTPVPPQTRQVAQAAFPRGNRYLQLRDTLGTLCDDALFADLFPQRGQAARAPWQLAVVTLLQFAKISPTAKRPMPCGAGLTGSTCWAWS